MKERLERARGRLALGLGPHGILRLRAEGCLQARFPRHAAHGLIEPVLVNTAGGIAGGDTLDTAVTLEPGARAVVTTQAAERAYRAREADDDASVATTLRLGADASLDWLPQELILFDGARLRRRLDVSLDASSVLVAVEMLVFGRVAHGEHVERLALDDGIRVTRDGTTLLHDRLRIDDAASLGDAARLGPARAAATVLHAGPAAAASLAPLRAALADADGSGGGTVSGASLACDGLLVARVLAPDAGTLRRTVMAALDTVRGERQAPRAWTL